MEYYNRGSEWRRWDLHIHTPETQKNDQFQGETVEEKWDKYYKDINDYIGDGSDPLKNIAVIGITDYMSIKNYKKVIKDDRLPKSVKMVIPNVEMRIAPIARNSPINIHCLFNPCIADQLERRFFSRLKFRYNDRDWGATSSELIALGREYSENPNMAEDAAYKKGIEQYVLSSSTLVEVFESDPQLRKDTIIAISNSDNDGVSGLKTHSEFLTDSGSQLDATRTQLYRLADMIFSSKQADRDYFLGKKADDEATVIKKYRSLKPCIHGSDAHMNENIFEPSQNKYCWIKADPTFNGLCQLLYEPEQRVRISQTKPEVKADYQVIERVEIEDEAFGKEAIVFSDKLTCIIGGKSTGKSLLLNNIARTIDKTQVADKTEKTKANGKLISEMKVYWADGSVVSTSKPDSKHKIVFIPQTYLNRLSDEHEELTEIDEIIHDILMVNPEMQKSYHMMEKELSEYKVTLDGKIFVLLRAYSDCKKVQDEIANIGTYDGITKEIEKLKKQKDGLSAGTSLTEDDIQKFDKAQSTLTKINAKLKELEADIEFILATDSVVEIISVPRDISDETKKMFIDTAEIIKLGAIKEWKVQKEKIHKELESQKMQLIDERNINEGIIKSIEPKIAENSAIKELTEAILKEEKKLFDFNEKTKRLKELESFYESLVMETSEAFTSFMAIHQKYAEVVNRNKDISTDGLEFSALTQFRGEAFLNKLGELFDRRQLKAHRDIFDIDDRILIEMVTVDKLKALIALTVEEKIKLTKGRTTESALRNLLDDWFNTAYQVKMDNDGIEEMSPGKKALVLLKMLINLAESECPILIDQPEDDLDNRSIFDELIPFIRKKKAVRQIIIVTHNANVVLGGDAEEIIVANQTGKNALNKAYRFEYRSGSIENDLPIIGEEEYVLGSRGIQQHICDILEGGKTAFDLRMHKYRM